MAAAGRCSNCSNDHDRDLDQQGTVHVPAGLPRCRGGDPGQDTETGAACEEETARNDGSFRAKMVAPSSEVTLHRPAWLRAIAATSASPSPTPPRSRLR